MPGKISQERLAGFLGVSRSVIQRIENGNQSPSSAELSAWQPLLSEEAKRQKADPDYAEAVANFVCYGVDKPPPLDEWRAKKKASEATQKDQETTEAVASEVSLTEVDTPPVNLSRALRQPNHDPLSELIAEAGASPEYAEAAWRRAQVGARRKSLMSSRGGKTPDRDFFRQAQIQEFARELGLQPGSMIVWRLIHS